MRRNYGRNQCFMLKGKLMNKELEKRVKDRQMYLHRAIYPQSMEESISIILAKETLIYETEARIEEHGDKCGYLFGGCEYCTKLQSELKMLKGEA